MKPNRPLYRAGLPRPYTHVPTAPTHSFSDPRRLVSIALQVLRKAGREQPADSVLRDVLRAQSGLSPLDSQEITRAVFAYYRWIGWTRDAESPEEGLRLAQEWERRFFRDGTCVTDEDLASRTVPDWIRQEMTVTPAWLRSLQHTPQLWIRVRRQDQERVEQELQDCAPPTLRDCPNALAYRGEADLFKTKLFQEGAFEVQDIASQVVGHLCAPQPGETWWDACAGEGGKLLHLSDLMGNKGMVWASDRAAWRLLKLKRRAARASVFNYRSAPWDGGEKLPTKTTFHGVLVDAPCSGVGTWQRNPHARWTSTPNDVRELSEIQLRILRHASRGVKLGGRLFYSVCTLTRAETTGVVAQFQQSVPGFTPEPLPEFSGLEPGAPHEAWIWPYVGKSNGMFVAAWKRTGVS